MISEAALVDLRSSPRPRLVLLPDALVDEPASVALAPGSFDPLTVAHAALAKAAGEIADLVVLVYSVRPLPKEGPGVARPLLAEADRLALLEAYCRQHAGTVVGLCSHGLLAEQVEAARLRFPRAKLFLTIGSDKLAQLFDPKWYTDRDEALEALFARARVLYAVRAGDEGLVREVLSRPQNAGFLDRLGRLAVPPDVAAISARVIREMIDQGQDVAALVPPEVRKPLGAALSR